MKQKHTSQFLDLFPSCLCPLSVPVPSCTFTASPIYCYSPSVPHPKHTLPPSLFSLSFFFPFLIQVGEVNEGTSSSVQCFFMWHLSTVNFSAESMRYAVEECGRDVLLVLSYIQSLLSVLSQQGLGITSCVTHNIVIYCLKSTIDKDVSLSLKSISPFSPAHTTHPAYDFPLKPSSSSSLLSLVIV